MIDPSIPTIPIGASCAAILSEALKNTRLINGYIFFSKTNTLNHFSGWSKASAQLKNIVGFDDFCLHDIRRSLCTKWAEDLRIPPHVIERYVNHISGQISGVAAIYNRASYIAEMREAVEKWEAHFTKIIEQNQNAMQDGEP